MLAILAYLGAVAALFVGAAFGLMVIVNQSAEVGRSLSSAPDANRTVAQSRPGRIISSEAEANTVSRTTGSAPKAERTAKDTRAKATKSRSAKTDKGKKRSAQATHERR
jgi:hypothetical protein